MIGGNVAGAQIHGYYPDGLTESDPLILERGRGEIVFIFYDEKL